MTIFYIIALIIKLVYKFGITCKAAPKNEVTARVTPIAAVNKPPPGKLVGLASRGIYEGKNSNISYNCYIGK